MSSHGRLTPEGKLVINTEAFAYDVEELSGLFDYYGWTGAYTLFVMEEVERLIKGIPAQFGYIKPDPRLTRGPPHGEDEIN